METSNSGRISIDRSFYQYVGTDNDSTSPYGLCLTAFKAKKTS